MTVGRNDPCPCQSGKKFKHCCALKPTQNPALTPRAPSPALNTNRGGNSAAPAGTSKTTSTGPIGATNSARNTAPLNPATLLKQATAHVQAQRWPQAELCCRQLLALEPRHAEALHLLGLMALAQGKHQTATGLIAQAIAFAAPPTASMYFNQGVAQHGLGQAAAAIMSLRQSLALQPGHAAAHFQLGFALSDAGEPAAAMASYQQAVALQPDYADAWNNLGMVQHGQGLLADAEASLRRALTLRPEAFAIMANIGMVLQKQGQPAAAEAVLRQALARQPGSAPLLLSLGTALKAQHRFDEAIACFRQAQALDGRSPQVSHTLNTALLEQGMVPEAVAALRDTLARWPERNDVHNSLLLALQYEHGGSAQALLAEHRRYAERVEAPLRMFWPLHFRQPQAMGHSGFPEAQEESPHASSWPAPARRLKIGYVSPDLHSHSLAFLIEPVLARHDRSRVEIFCYYNNDIVDEVSERLRGLAEHWQPCLDLDDAALAAQIAADDIDILVDLAGYTAMHRLHVFARKPAPVQVTWLGYPGSTALSAIDYRLTDALLDPPGVEASCYTEVLHRLPAWAAYAPPAESPPVSVALPALSTGHVTLACLNNLTKVSVAVVRVWAHILHALPTATLLLGNARDPGVQARLQQQFAQQGIGPERLELLPRLPMADYLALHHRIDFALDPFPFTGAITSWHSLWMGVPVLTLSGPTTASRQGQSIMQGIGLPEFVAYSEEDYVQRALALAADLPTLQALRPTLRKRTHEHFNPERVTRALEKAYEEMWARWCESFS